MKGKVKCVSEVLRIPHEILQFFIYLFWEEGGGGLVTT